MYYAGVVYSYGLCAGMCTSGPLLSYAFEFEVTNALPEISKVTVLSFFVFLSVSLTNHVINSVNIKVFLERLVVTHLVKKFLTFCGTRRFSTMLTRAHQFSYTMLRCKLTESFISTKIQCSNRQVGSQCDKIQDSRFKFSWETEYGCIPNAAFGSL
jgi:hypothetical protein